MSAPTARRALCCVRIWTCCTVIQLLAVLCVSAEPWNLKSYELCYHKRLQDIPNEASGVTYSSVTNSLWVITRRPQAVIEYSLKGEKLRQVSHRGLRDPEGITWMYGYIFAVAQEGGGRAAITIMDISPWNRAVEVLRKLVLPEVRCKSNFCFEGITYNVNKNVFYAVQEMDPMRMWEVTPSGKARQLLNGQTSFPGLRDLAGTYYALGLNRLFVLSQTEQKVAELKWNGEMVEDQVVNVYDNVVEGLTFTPDGHLMINVGEPNDLWVYSSTDSCNWKPKAWMVAEPETGDLRPAREPPTIGDVDGGYCNWNSCKGGRQGTGWCNFNSDHCVKGCGGVWCWRDTIGKPLTKDTLASKQPRKQGPLLREVVPSPGPGSKPAPPAASPQPAPKESWQPPSQPQWKTSGANSKESTNSSRPRGTQRDSDGDRRNVGDVIVEIVDSSFQNGYLAVLTLLLQEVSVWQFTPLMQLYFREAVAYAAYGNGHGFLQVVFSNPAVDQRNAVFSGILSVPDLQSDDMIVQELLDAMGHPGRRHLLQGVDGQDYIALTVRLLAETSDHALLLANNTRAAIESGELVSDMMSRGFQYDTEIDLLGIKIQGAGVAPQYYPASQNLTDELPDVTYREDFSEIIVTLLPSDVKGSGGGVSMPSILAGVAVGTVAMLALIGGTVLYRSLAAKRARAAGVIPRHADSHTAQSVPSKASSQSCTPSDEPPYTSDDASSSSGADLESGPHTPLPAQYPPAQQDIPAPAPVDTEPPEEPHFLDGESDEPVEFPHGDSAACQNVSITGDDIDLVEVDLGAPEEDSLPSTIDGDSVAAAAEEQCEAQP